MEYTEVILNRAKKQKASAPKLIGDLVILNSPNILSTVRKRWLIGESVFGGKIGDYKPFTMPNGETYQQYKISLNPSAKGYVDLTLSGALGDGLTIKKIVETDFKVFSTDFKYNKIGDKYGFEEFGLSDLEWQEMSDEILIFALESMLKKTYE